MYKDLYCKHTVQLLPCTFSQILIKGILYVWNLAVRTEFGADYNLPLILKFVSSAFDITKASHISLNILYCLGLTIFTAQLSTADLRVTVLYSLISYRELISWGSILLNKIFILSHFVSFFNTYKPITVCM